MKNTIRLYFHPNKRGFTNTVYFKSIDEAYAPFAEFLDTCSALEFAYTEACTYHSTTYVVSEEENVVYVVEPDEDKRYLYLGSGEELVDECNYYDLDCVEWILFPLAD